MRKRLVALTGAFLLFLAGAAQAFTVEEIRIRGLERIAEGTVLNYLPVAPGDDFGDGDAADAIEALYDTGFFEDVSLLRDGNRLIVSVVERPAIARIEFNGNDEIGDDDLREGLAGAGLGQGQSFDRSLLETIERELEQQYFALGFYDVQVSSTVSPLPRNRVALRLDIREGEPAAVQEITFVGNEAYDDDTLRDEFQMGPAPWWALFSNRDKYSRARLSGDLETLRAFYRDRGYINFEIVSTQVAITPDRQRIHITVNLDEGERYEVGDVDLAGELIFAEAELRELLAVESGSTYSQAAVTRTVEALREKLGERGYAFANVNPVPDVDEEAGTVNLTFFVDPAERVYVRRIRISGNERTRDDVIRGELRQLEGAWLSTEELRESERRLGRLGFFSDVSVETPRVPGESDQVDVEVDVTERLSGSLQAGIGFGTDQGVILNFGVSQDNLFGTGDRVEFAANSNRYNTLYRLSYLERNHTVSGIDRRYSLSYRDVDAEEADLADYGLTSITAAYGYRIPVSSNDTIGADLEVDDITLDLRNDATALQRDFVDRNGERNQVLRANLSWTRDTRDRAVFPRSGARQQARLEVSVPGSDLEYYRATYEQSRYFSLTEMTTVAFDGSLSYGDAYGTGERLPFYENYYAGGISTVRGFEGNSLGPRDENDDPTGGNLRALGRVELRFPLPGDAAQENLRLATFIDAGQVWDAETQDVNSSDLRYSAGLGLIWYSPLGPLTMSVAQPLNDEPNDETQTFQFSLGAFF
ncbi:outer membrane protein assembly factor BamA [Sediminicurvatus halobius]|uniref:Outer membrane protein assembly factor BamA n=1 Tax=Sediminicurvatus halobius TaxID=2182432 RepID=A0A2U2N497_9GAMM|nr:outer membrane protein assembly factor BamA [Spiribacter halobius]PWG63912.1 outer membrane protein assembly factor BamA [Spiribacter halobius]UEX76325.1 outer membrane protein assembly factor BamA [Spiribacter halobius]